jgi:hypothetical protein
MANERLRVAMTAVGLALDQVAAKVEVDPKTVERWVTTGRVPHRTHRRLMAQLVGRDEAYLWPDIIDDAQSQRASEQELVRFYPSRAAVPGVLWRSLLDGTTEAVEIFVYAGQFLIDAHPDLPGLLTQKARSGTRVRLLLGDPDCEAVRRRGEEEGIGADLAARIRLSLAGVRPALSAPGVEVRLHDSTLYCSTYRFDDDMFVNTHILGAPAAHAPVLHLHRMPGGRLFERYLAGFDKAWQPATQGTGQVARSTMAG